jgi:saccharopine dehydrogenase (NADP+, L-glutamate forming)
MLEAYVNRDSLQYRQHYGLSDVATMIRYTLRYPGFCRAWQALVQLGLTDDSYEIQDLNGLTYGHWLESFLPHGNQSSIDQRLSAFLGVANDDQVMEKLRWLGILSDERIPTKKGTPADVLLALLLRKWEMNPNDKDMVVMYHAIESEREGKRKRVTSTLVAKGEDSLNTAMTKLVGLPLGIFAKHLMRGKIESRGVHLPVTGEFYGPVLKELEEIGVRFEEKEVSS